MTTINTMQDLTRLLKENPEWRDEIRRELLTEELLELPQKFAEYAELTDRRLASLEENLAALTARVDALTVRVDSLTATVDALTARVDALTARVDALTVTVDLLTARVDALTVRVDALTARVDSLTQKLDILVDGFDRLTGRVDTLTNKVDRMRGFMLEQRLTSQLPPLVSREFDVRRVYPIWTHSINATNQRTQEFDNVLEEAAETGVISDDDETRLRVTDLIMRAQRKSDRSTLWFALEASGVIGYEDITRARRSAHALTKIYKQDAAPLVYGYQIYDEQMELANDLEVRVFIDPEGD